MEGAKAVRVRNAMIALVVFIVGLGVGLAIGNADEAPDPGGSASGPGSAAAEGQVPDVCLDAIEAARAELRIRSEGLDLAGRYPDVAERAVDAIRDVDTQALEEVVSELNDLNSDMRAALDEFTQNDFSTPARECEELATTSG